MSLTLDYQTLRKTQLQQTIALLDQLSYLSVAVREVHEQKKRLFLQRQLFQENRPAYWEQWQALCTEESTLLEELRAILAQLAPLESKLESKFSFAL